MSIAILLILEMGIIETRESYMSVYNFYNVVGGGSSGSSGNNYNVKCYQICRLTVFAAWYLRHLVVKQQQLVFQ